MLHSTHTQLSYYRLLIKSEEKTDKNSFVNVNFGIKAILLSDFSERERRSKFEATSLEFFVGLCYFVQIPSQVKTSAQASIHVHIDIGVNCSALTNCVNKRDRVCASLSSERV